MTHAIQSDWWIGGEKRSILFVNYLEWQQKNQKHSQQKVPNKQTINQYCFARAYIQQIFLLRILHRTQDSGKSQRNWNKKQNVQIDNTYIQWKQLTDKFNEIFTQNTRKRKVHRTMTIDIKVFSPFFFSSNFKSIFIWFPETLQSLVSNMFYCCLCRFHAKTQNDSNRNERKWRRKTSRSLKTSIKLMWLTLSEHRTWRKGAQTYNRRKKNKGKICRNFVVLLHKFLFYIEWVVCRIPLRNEQTMLNQPNPFRFQCFTQTRTIRTYKAQMVFWWKLNYN